MELLYQSTRNKEIKVTASQAILKGLAGDGGLFVPERIPGLGVSLEDISKMSYKETAYEVMKLFLTDFTEAELKECINKAYDSKFDTDEIAPLTEKAGVYYLELFHGATLAFKDMALSILPHLLTVSAKKNNTSNEIVILTATSGDTGKAALAGFADVPGTRIIVFYPVNGVSKIQKRQMVTQKGANTSVIGITGNFDDAQNGVKAMFNNKELAEAMAKHNYQFSSANSINIGRLVPQVVYYVYSYAKLLAGGAVKPSEPVNFVVPTGNFGNILAAYYAKNMGVPVNRLICASNENKVLFDFFETGIYDKNREFVLTSSPSMDILVSSNLERLIYKISGEDAGTTSDLMAALAKDGRYILTPDMRAAMEGFTGGWADEEKTAAEIKRIYEETGYIIDTHTAVASAVYHEYKEKTKDNTVTVIASTASPYKFVTSVMGAIDSSYKCKDDFVLIDELGKKTGTKIPPAIEEICTAPVLHNTVCKTEDMQKEVEKILGI